MVDLKILKSGKIAKITLDGECTIQHAAEFKKALLTSLQSGNKTIVDTTHVSAVDLSYLQLIYSAQITADQEKKICVIGPKPADVFCQAVANSGFILSFDSNVVPYKNCFRLKGVVK